MDAKYKGFTVYTSVESLCNLCIIHLNIQVKIQQYLVQAYLSHTKIIGRAVKHDNTLSGSNCASLAMNDEF